MTVEELAYGLAAFGIAAFSLVCAWLTWEVNNDKEEPPC